MIKNLFLTHAHTVWLFLHYYFLPLYVFERHRGQKLNLCPFSISLPRLISHLNWTVDFMNLHAVKERETSPYHRRIPDAQNSDNGCLLNPIWSAISRWLFDTHFRHNTIFFIRRTKNHCSPSSRWLLLLFSKWKLHFCVHFEPQRPNELELYCISPQNDLNSTQLSARKIIINHLFGTTRI